MWRSILSKGDLFLDIGANIGGYSIWAAELGADVIALEPAEDTFRILTDNIELNDYPITAIQAAAGATCGTANFTTGHDALNRLSPQGAAEVKVVTIDSVIGDRVVSGMKIDVEGFEMDVLRGSQRALHERRIKMIQMEWNHECMRSLGTDRRPVAELMAAHGYSLYRPTQAGVSFLSRILDSARTCSPGQTRCERLAPAFAIPMPCWSYAQCQCGRQGIRNWNSLRRVLITVIQYVAVSSEDIGYFRRITSGDFTGDRGTGP